ncbi:NUDIX hydrolase [Rhizobium rhizogenes]|jgi:ADP-ribose pyrophosphatase YjhB (NUDIX family)|uniref:NUDIX hydrolase n=1 Tax=Rhizobium rhizogenes TaxID=359 RepID=UPI003ED04E99
MNRNEPHLARLAAHVETMLHGDLAEQIGAICIRPAVDETVEVLLVTTSEKHHWTIPKGWAIDGLKPHEVAERKSWEKAGIRGKARENPFGYYTYLKVLDSETAMPSMVAVHVLDVEDESDTFPKSGQLTTEWLSPPEAAIRVEEPELKGLISRLMDRAAA